MKKISLWLSCFAFGILNTTAQEKQLLDQNLSGFKNPAQNWKIAGDATTNPFIDNDLTYTSGTGVLINIHEHGKYGSDYELISDFKHGDADISFDFMMAKGSNSGVYMQGNYEIQLLDSWGKQNPTYGDCGGIYHRWNESLPEGQKGYEGHAPRINACKAPGLWQHMEISFKAPRFNEKGEKISNAMILFVKLNGQLLHENVELSGPSRGSLTEKDVATGPLRFQGDHGSLAFKNIVFKPFDKAAASLQNLKYSVSYAPYDPSADPYKLKVDDSGSLKELSWEFLKQPNEYSYLISGDFVAPESGNYDFSLYSASNNYLKINDKWVLPNKYTGPNDARNAQVYLEKGNHSLALYAAKYDAWMNPTLGLFVSGPGFRNTALHSAASMFGNKATDPIFIDASSNTMLRSFMDFDNGETKTRVTHAINIGSPSGLHYTYDLDHGALLQFWRGGFLDATPMWDSRGDGSSRPRGALTKLSNDFTLHTSAANWPKDSSGLGFRPLGYELDKNDIPTFMYRIAGETIKDKISVAEGKYFERTIDTGNSTKLIAKLGSGQKIEKLADGLYAVNHKTYMIKLTEGTEAMVLSEGDQQSLFVKINKKLTYQMMF